MNNDDIVPGFDEGKDDSVKLKLQRIEGMEGGLVIYAIGYIDTYNSYSFQKRVDKAIEAGFVRIIFELSGISYMSSTGLATFPNFLKTVKSRKGDMVLDNVQAKVFEVFQILGLSQFFTFQDDFNESIADLENQVQSSPFPMIFSCPICSKRLRSSKPGRFRCGECKAVLLIDQTTKVLVG